MSVQDKATKTGWLDVWLNPRKELLTLLAVALVSWLVGYVFLSIIDLDVMVSDVKSYWEDSQTLVQKIHRFHQPGYPFVIAVLHSVLPALDPVILLHLIALGAWLAGMAVMYLLLNRVAGEMAWYGALAFGLFPLVGLSNTLYPLSDALAGLVLLLCLYGYFTKRRLLLVVGIAASLMVHKALWPMLGMLVLISFVEKRLSVIDVVLSGTPLLIYWLMGAQQFSDYFWIVRSNLEVELSSRSQAPLFDGFYSALAGGGA